MYSVRFFACPQYRNLLSSVLLGNAGIYAAWHVLPPDQMNRHFTFSWQGIIRDQKLWTIWTSHFSHCSANHLISNTSVFLTLGYALQRVMPVTWLGVNLLCAPLVASISSLVAVYCCHGPFAVEALDQDQGLDWNAAWYHQYLDLRNGLQAMAAPPHCDFKKLGILREGAATHDDKDARDLMVEHVARRQEWYYESARGTLGMSAIALSLQGFGAAWLAHLGASGMLNSVVKIGLGVLLFQPGMDAAALFSQGANAAHECTDYAAHLSGFSTGLFLYFFRSRGLAKLITPRFAAI